MAEEQNFSNHTRWVPAFHFFAGPLLAIHLGWRIYRMYTTLDMGHGRGDALVNLLLAAALIVVFLYARLFAAKAQDRVIRLEERMRLERLLPADLKPRIGELSCSQLVALRFASDGELAELTGRVLKDNITERKAIKQMIKNWRPDHDRV